MPKKNDPETTAALQDTQMLAPGETILNRRIAAALAGDDLASHDLASHDLASLGHLARGGSLDLTAVTLRVRTDLLVTSQHPSGDDLKSYVEFALAVLPTLGPRDLAIISHKLAGWPHTPQGLKKAVIARFPSAMELFYHPQEMAASANKPGATPSPRRMMQDQDDALRADLLGEARHDDAEGDMQHGVQDRMKDRVQDHVQDHVQDVAGDPAGLAPVSSSGSSQTDHEIAGAQRALAKGEPWLAEALLARADLRAADHAPFFLQASPVQQGLILSGLEQLERLQPRKMMPRQNKDTMDGLMNLASTDRVGAFLELADTVGGTPEFAARMTLDTSRKLSGLAVLAIGGAVEDAVRFAIKLGDESSCSVQVVFGLAETLRSATPATAMRLLRAIAGAELVREALRPTRHIPAADPSGTPDRGQKSGMAQENRGATSPLDVVRRLTAK